VPRYLDGLRCLERIEVELKLLRKACIPIETAQAIDVPGQDRPASKPVRKILVNRDKLLLHSRGGRAIEFLFCEPQYP
jgi:hypothetical protein